MKKALLAISYSLYFIFPGKSPVFDVKIPMKLKEDTIDLALVDSDPVELGGVFDLMVKAIPARVIYMLA